MVEPTHLRKICSSNWKSSSILGVKLRKCLSCHHLAFHWRWEDKPSETSKMCCSRNLARFGKFFLSPLSSRFTAVRHTKFKRMKRIMATGPHQVQVVPSGRRVDPKTSRLTCGSLGFRTMAPFQAPASNPSLQPPTDHK